MFNPIDGDMCDVTSLGIDLHGFITTKGSWRRKAECEYNTKEVESGIRLHWHQLGPSYTRTVHNGEYVLKILGFTNYAEGTGKLPLRLDIKHICRFLRDLLKYVLGLCQ